MSWLIVDIGNSRVKYCTAENKTLGKVFNCSHQDALGLLVENIHLNEFDSAIVSSTASEKFTQELVGLISSKTKVLEVSHELDLPFKINYKTPNTLGLDRIANVCGALHFSAEDTSLIIDIGTCITYDVLHKGKNYLGGAISPGLKMRFKAMNDYSARLPRLENFEEVNFPGRSTEESLKNGVYYGILGEINEFIKQTEQSFGELKVHLTGGDFKSFEKGLKSPIFANPKLTLWGLYELLKSNS